MLKKAEISASTFGSGKSGDLLVEGDSVVLSGDGVEGFTGIAAQAIRGKGNAGNLMVRAGRLEVLNEANISASTFSSGNGGDLLLEADSVVLSGDGAKGFTGITAQAASGSSGNAGKLTVESHSVEIRNGAVISVGTFSKGNGGNLLVEADSVFLSGDGAERFTGVSSSTGIGSSGNAGDVKVVADTLEVRDGAAISSSTRSVGKGGDTAIIAGNVILSDGGDISATSTRTGLDIEDNPEAGQSGNVFIMAHDTLRLLNDSSVSVKTAEANAGSIEFKVGSLVHLRDRSSITTSVAGGTGNGGNIIIDPIFVVLDGASEIRADAQRGKGGNVNIQITGGGAFFISPDSVVSASSEFGIDGSILVNAPDTGIRGTISTLPASFFDVSSLLSERCSARAAENMGSFVVLGSGGVPLNPNASLLS